MENNKIKISIQLDEKTLTRLAEVARMHDRSRASMIRIIIDEWLKGSEK